MGGCMAKIKNDPFLLGTLLLQRGLVDSDQLRHALARHRSCRQRPLGEHMVDLGYLSSEQLGAALHLQQWLRVSALVIAANTALLAVDDAQAANSDSVRLIYRAGGTPQEQLRAKPTPVQYQLAAKRLDQRRAAFAHLLTGSQINTSVKVDCANPSTYATLPQRCGSLSPRKNDR